MTVRMAGVSTINRLNWAIRECRDLRVEAKQTNELGETAACIKLPVNDNKDEILTHRKDVNPITNYTSISRNCTTEPIAMIYV